MHKQPEELVFWRSRKANSSRLFVYKKQDWHDRLWRQDKQVKSVLQTGQPHSPLITAQDIF